MLCVIGIVSLCDKEKKLCDKNKQPLLITSEVNLRSFTVNTVIKSSFSLRIFDEPMYITDVDM